MKPAREMIVAGRAVHGDVDRLARQLAEAGRRLARFEWQYDRLEELRTAGGDAAIIRRDETELAELLEAILTPWPNGEATIF